MTRARGRPDAEIARVLGVADQTVARWARLDISEECQNVEPVLLPQAELDAIAKRLKDEAKGEVRLEVDKELADADAYKTAQRVE